MSHIKLNYIKTASIKNLLRYNPYLFIALMLLFCSCKNHNLVEKSGQWEQIRNGEYLVENNTWNVQAAKSSWTQTIFYDTLKGSMGWKWDFSGEKGKPDPVTKSYPEIIFGKKPYNVYKSTTSRLPTELTSAKFRLGYDYEAKAIGIYNTITDISFTDSKNPDQENIRAKMMIWFDHQNMPFFESENLKQAKIGGNQCSVFIDTTYIGPEGKWNFIAVLSENFPLKGELNLNDYFDYFLAEGALRPEWYLSSIEIGSEICSGKGEITFKQFAIY
jgi:hypothetical protein